MAKTKKIKYKDIPKKLARECCKQHSYKTRTGKRVLCCEKCPLERKGKFCWYIIKALHDDLEKENKKCPLEKTEYDALMLEDVDKQLEWENWINSQESLD